MDGFTSANACSTAIFSSDLREKRLVMGWFKPKTIHVTFEKLGYPQFWVDIKESGSYLVGEADEIAGGLTEESTTEEAIEALSRMIVDWNMLDPETDAPLSVPTRKDPSSVLRMPNALIRHLQEEVTRHSEEYTAEGAVKKGIETPLEAISEDFEGPSPPSG